MGGRNHNPYPQGSFEVSSHNRMKPASRHRKGKARELGWHQEKPVVGEEMGGREEGGEERSRTHPPVREREAERQPQRGRERGFPTARSIPLQKTTRCTNKGQEKSFIQLLRGYPTAPRETPWSRVSVALRQRMLVSSFIR
ncbi:hypothetical protein EYF80_010981 [Liparis tanakae]|uniref:Uncharacterized protein n=1 Tax=Liparis tanakae TaxID=230148 RepID=A0A4Z2ILZ5_9TELE|nr:hypothetical protein EYF80_010981 [Liparis tanakae]